MLTIVVPVYNREQLIVRCLDSIYAQTYRPLRVIVVDNNSTDGTRAAAACWAAQNNLDDTGDFRFLLVDEKTPGAAAARRRGTQEVDTEWVAFFDSDDAMVADYAEIAMSHRHGNDIVYWKRELVNISGSRRVLPFKTSELLLNQIVHSILATQAYMVRTEVLRRCGGWKSEIKVWNDWELGIRLLQTAPGCYAIPRVLSIVYAQAESITGLGYLDKKGEWEKIISIAERDIIESQMPDKDAYLRWLTYKRVILAAHYKKEGAGIEADRLLEKIISDSGLSAFRKGLLRLIYRYTSKGGRGAYLLWR